MTRRRTWALLLVVGLLGAACSNGTAGPAAGDGPTPAQKIYDAVAPSIAYIETEVATGSAILIDETTLLTAAHVVWPYRAVRVVFPDGQELVDAPVIGTDPYSDLAIVDVSSMGSLPAPATIGDGESIPPGRPMYLVGYPGETESFPQPTITEGILSRIREWRAEDWTFLQSDAPVAGGQSGGALVDEDGRVVGITNFGFSDEFGLSGSLGDAPARIDRMRAGEDPGGLGDRLPPDGPGAKNHERDIDVIWRVYIFVFEAPLYSTVSFDVAGEADLALTLNTIDGIEITTADDTTDGFETIDEVIDYRGMYLLRVESVGGTGSVSISANVPVTEWVDPDDGRVLERGETISGNADYAGDYDWYRIDLAAGETVTFDVDAIAFDPALMIDGPEGDGILDAYDGDSGGGVFGTNPQITYTADEKGSFFVIVADDGETGPGAYRLTVN